MNLMEDIAQKLGVGQDEKFKIKEDFWEREYMFMGSSLVRIEEDGSLPIIADDILVKLISGKATIVKLRYKPRYGDGYFTVNWSKGITPSISKHIWLGDTLDYAMLSLGNVFSTIDEANEQKKNVVNRAMDIYNRYR